MHPALRRMVGAVLDGEHVDWERAGHDAQVQEFAPTLRALEGARPVAALGDTPATTATATLARWVVVAIAVSQLVAALVGFFVGIDVGTPVPASAALLAVTAFSVSAAWLFVGGKRDDRARRLAVVFLLVASAFGRRFMGVVAGPLSVLVRGVYPDAFLPAFAWAFSRDFPRLIRLSWWDEVSRRGTSVAAAASVALFVANVVRAYAPDSVPSLLARSHPRSLYWAIVIGLAIVALLVSLMRARSAEADERQRTLLFALALSAPLVPVCTEILAEIVSADFKRAMSDPVVRRAVAPALFALLLSVPALTAYTLVTTRALDVRIVLARTLQFAFAKLTLAAAAVLPLGAFAAYAYKHRSLPIEALLATWPGRGLFLLSTSAIVGLIVQRHVLGAVERRVLGATLDVGDALAALAPALRGARTLRELADRVDETVQRALGATSVRLLRVDPSRHALTRLHQSGDELPVDSAIVAVLSSAVAPLIVGEGHTGSYYRVLPGEERQWVDRLGIVVLSPLVDSRSELVGALAIGARANGAEWRRPDLQYLDAAASAVALACDSMHVTASPEPAGSPAAVECVGCGIVGEPSEARCSCDARRVAAPLPALVAGKFRVERRLGAGGIGVAYLGVDLGLARPVVLKTLPQVSSRAARRLSDEARRMASVEHTNLATLYGLEWWQGAPILVMEFLEGGTLASRIAQGPVAIADAVRVGHVLARALEHLHESGVLHRDIKPSNIAFSRQDDTPKLLDFGLATLIDRERESGGLMGTPHYLPPDAFDGAAPGPGWDVWALAMTVYQAIAGQHPFDDAHGAEVFRVVRQGRVPDVRRFRPDCPSRIASMLAAALSRDPAARFGTAGALERQLGSCLAESG